MSLLNGKVRMSIAAAVFLGLAFFLNQWQNQLEKGVTRLAREYRLDADIAKRKPEYIKAYEAVSASVKLPAEKPFRQNEWVQFAQGLASGRELSLKELKPVYRQVKGRKKAADVFLVLEGPMPELIRFLYQISRPEDLVYVEQMLITQSDDKSGLVRTQMTLTQEGTAGRV